MTNRFYIDLPVTTDFTQLLGDGPYQPMPDDWVIGLTDVVNSTAAIAAGRYKAVNMAGAASVVAMMNVLETMTIPFAFGGDGASFAVEGDQAGLAREGLARTGAIVRDEFGLELRTALVPVKDIRAAGHDVRVARFGPSAHVSYAMFRGGGLNWASEAMKAGQFAIEAGEEGQHPDLHGLSCRFNSVAARHGVILSAILLPSRDETPEFDALVQEIFELTGKAGEAGRPFANRDDLTIGKDQDGLRLEVSTSLVLGYPRGLIRFERKIFRALTAFLLNGNRKVGRFDAGHYKTQVIANSDYRKMDDGLRMTIDCTPALADRIEQRLEAAQQAGIARFGLHRQSGAVMTCFVPSAANDTHIHFVDGASGGYAAAAAALKAKENAPSR